MQKSAINKIKRRYHVLNLAERVQALRLFDRVPVYKRVASALNCSSGQIRNIVLFREYVLKEYARLQIIRSNDSFEIIRVKKLAFLGDVLYEYLRRACYHGGEALTEESILERVLEFRDAIGIEQFIPTKDWVNDYLRFYHLDINCMQNLVIPPKTLDRQQIIAYCKISSLLNGAVDARVGLLCKISHNNESADVEVTHESYCKTFANVDPVNADPKLAAICPIAINNNSHADTIFGTFDETSSDDSTYVTATCASFCNPVINVDTADVVANLASVCNTAVEDNAIHVDETCKTAANNDLAYVKAKLPAGYHTIINDNAGYSDPSMAGTTFKTCCETTIIDDSAYVDAFSSSFCNPVANVDTADHNTAIKDDAVRVDVVRGSFSHTINDNSAQVDATYKSFCNTSISDDFVGKLPVLSSTTVNDDPAYHDLSVVANTSNLQTTAIYENISDDENSSEDPKGNSNLLSNLCVANYSVEIQDASAALAHLALLRSYALDKNDFCAVSLISSLATHFALQQSCANVERK